MYECSMAACCVYRYLTVREQKLLERKKQASDLLRWRQDLDAEEEKVLQLERHALKAWESRGVKDTLSPSPSPTAIARDRKREETEKKGEQCVCVCVVSFLSAMSSLLSSSLSHS
jgi:hypothetical protein